MHALFYLALIWVAVLAAHVCATKSRLTPVLWFLAFGFLLANFGALPQEHSEFIDVFAEIGIIFIMFAIGFEENVADFLHGIKHSWGIAFFGALVPFGIAYSFSFYFWQDGNIALMCGLAMTATAVSLTMVSLRSEGLGKTRAATGIMTSAVLDDIASLAAVAILVPIALGDATADLFSILLLLARAMMFFALIVVIRITLLAAGKSQHRLLKEFRLDRLFSVGDGEHTTLIVLLFALLIALLGEILGLHVAVGAYMAGLIFREDNFPRLGQSEAHNNDVKSHPLFEETRRTIDSIAFSWIGPVFFVNLGAQIIFEPTVLVSIIDEALLLFAGIFIGQVLSAGLAAYFTGGFTASESLLIGLGMLGRAELAFVVINIAYVQNALLNEEAFYTLMLTSLLLNIAVPLSIRYWNKRFNPTVGQLSN